MKTQHRLAVALTTTVATLTIGAAIATAEPALSIEPSTGLAAGDTVTVTGSGFDPEAGYYLSTCLLGTSGPSGPECAGSQSERGTSTWVTNNPRAAGMGSPIDEDGSFTAELTVAVATDTIDCQDQACGITAFYDHMNGFGTVAEAPVTFAGSGTAAESSTTEEVETDTTATEVADAGSSTPWIIGGVAAALVIGAGAYLMVRRRGN